VQFCWQTKLSLAVVVLSVFPFSSVVVRVRPCISVASVAPRCFLLSFRVFRFAFVDS
jgi:hypothetical protein